MLRRAFWLTLLPKFLPTSLAPVSVHLRVWQLIQQQFFATGLAGWNFAIIVEFHRFSGRIERALVAVARENEKFGPPSPDRGSGISDWQAQWQTPAAVLFAHMRASESRRARLLKQVEQETGATLRSRPAPTLVYHCVIWSACLVLTALLSVGNLVLFASPSVLVVQTDESGMRVALDSGDNRTVTVGVVPTQPIHATTFMSRDASDGFRVVT